MVDDIISRVIKDKDKDKDKNDKIDVKLTIDNIIDKNINKRRKVDSHTFTEFHGKLNEKDIKYTKDVQDALNFMDDKEDRYDKKDNDKDVPNKQDKDINDHKIIIDNKDKDKIDKVDIQSNIPIQHNPNHQYNTNHPNHQHPNSISRVQYHQHNDPNIVTNQQFKLNIINKHPNDSRIYMQEKEHRYFIDNESPSYITSVTSIIHSYFHSFDADKVINKYYDKWQSDECSHDKYRGKSKEEIKEMWEINKNDSCSSGTEMHSRLERFYNGNTIEDGDESRGIEWKYALNYNRDMIFNRNLRIYRTEWILFIKELWLCGSIDAVFRVPNTDNEVIVIDWKRSKEIKKNGFFGQTGIGICKDLPDCNLSTYQLQLNLYAYMLQSQYNLLVKEAWIVVFHPDNSNYVAYPVKNMQQSHIIPMISERKAYIDNINKQNNSKDHNDKDYNTNTKD